MRGLPVQDTSRIWFDPTGLVRLPDTRVIQEHTFENHNTHGWGALKLTGPGRGGIVETNEQGGWSLYASTPSVAGVLAMAIHRGTQHLGVGEHLLEYKTYAMDRTLDLTRPRWREFGLDVAHPFTGARHFFAVRHKIYDEALAATANVFEYNTNGSPQWLTMPGGGQIPVNGGVWPTNENKKLAFYMALHVNTATGQYLGFQFGDWIKVGSLATNPADPIIGANAFAGAVAGASPNDLDPFAGGLNPFFGIQNRSNATLTAGCQGIEWHRLSRVAVVGN